MRQLSAACVQRFNRRHRRIGHVFQGRHNVILVQENSYLLELSCYIVLNLVKARMVVYAQGWLLLVKKVRIWIGRALLDNGYRLSQGEIKI